MANFSDFSRIAASFVGALVVSVVLVAAATPVVPIA